jgi:hypothetical protein
VALFVWLSSHQPAVLFSQNKPTINNQPAVLFSQNKSAPAISHQPNEQAVYVHVPAPKTVLKKYGQNQENFLLAGTGGQEEVSSSEMDQSY